MRSAERRAILVLLACGIAVGLGLAFVPPRLTLVNAALRISYPWTAMAGAALAAVSAAALAAVPARRPVRAAAVLVAAAAATLAAARSLYALEAGSEAVSERRLVTRSVLPWREVTRVDTSGSAISMTGASGNRVTIQTAWLRPEQRAALERTVSRRIRERSR